MANRVLRNLIDSNGGKFFLGGISVGIPLYSYHFYTTRHMDMDIYSQPNINHNQLQNVNKKDSKNDLHDHTDLKNINNINIGQQHVAIDDQFELNPSFKTRFLYKLYHLDFHEIRRSEVLIELLLLSCPAIFAGILSYKTYFTHLLKWKRKHFYNSVNISINTLLTNNDIHPTRFDIRVRTILETKIDDIIPNEKGINLIINAAKKTDELNPFIIIDNDEARKSINNLLRDHITQLSYQTHITKDLLNYGYGNIRDNKTNQFEFNQRYFISSKYVMFITFWPQSGIGSNAVFNQKIRVQLIKKQSLRLMIEKLDVNDNDIWMKGFCGGFFKDRWNLLQTVAREFKNEERNRFTQSLNPYISQCELSMINPMASGYNYINIKSQDPDEVNHENKEKKLINGEDCVEYDHGGQETMYTRLN